jgi:hypothetical protein
MEISQMNTVVRYRSDLLLYTILFFARPFGVFFFSWGSTFGV